MRLRQRIHGGWSRDIVVSLFLTMLIVFFATPFVVQAFSCMPCKDGFIPSFEGANLCPKCLSPIQAFLAQYINVETFLYIAVFTLYYAFVVLLLGSLVNFGDTKEFLKRKLFWFFLFLIPIFFIVFLQLLYFLFVLIAYKVISFEKFVFFISYINYYILVVFIVGISMKKKMAIFLQKKRFWISVFIIPIVIGYFFKLSYNILLMIRNILWGIF